MYGLSAGTKKCGHCREVAISGGSTVLLYGVKPLVKVIAHFRVALSLSIKARPGAQPFI